MNVFLREVSRELGRMGHRLDVFTRRDHPDQPAVVEIDEGVRLIHLSAGPAASRSRNQISRHIPQMTQALMEWPADAYDVIHAHYWISGAAGRAWTAGSGIPLVQMFHTMERTKRRLLGDLHIEDTRRSGEEDSLGRSADALTVGSRRDRDSLASDYRIPAGKIHIVPGGVNPDVFFPQDQAVAQTRADLPKGRVVLFVGRIEPVKGLETLIRALTLLRRQEGDHCNWNLVIIGGSPHPAHSQNGGRRENGMPASEADEQTYPGKIRKLIDDLGMSDRVTFLGSKPQQVLADYYAAADCCVFPSRYETFGLAVIEALSCGAMVVASDVGGYPRMMAQERAGLLVPAGDGHALAKALDQVCAESALREDLRRRAPAVGRRFAWKDTARRLLEVYQSLIDNRPGFVGRARNDDGSRRGTAIHG
ncbi:MAG: glycosyltransferase [Nitrospinota bacterium]|nr:glycosyltransferase [Nitrospinota bacterium]